MLNSVPKQIVLTLQSSPPFLLEIILAVTIALLVSIPLISRVQYYLGYTEEPVISFDLFNSHRRHQISSSTSGSNESLTLFPLRHVNSSPNFKNSNFNDSNNFNMDINSSYSHSPDYPFSVAYDYGYYRHKLIETNLKRHYGCQAPGNVVLNSLHLSSIDSTTGLRLSEKYNHSIFELVPTDHNQDRDQLITLIHPRDHFLKKGNRRYEAVDKSTETLFVGNVGNNYYNNINVEEESEFREKSPISLPTRRKISRIKKDKSSDGNVKIFKIKIDSSDNSRPVSPFKNREIYEIPEVKSEIIEKGKEIYGRDSKLLNQNFREEINEIGKSRPGSPVKKIKGRKSKVMMNFKVRDRDRDTKLREVKNKDYDSLIIDNYKEGENLDLEEEMKVNKKISSATVELNVGSENLNINDNVNITGEEDDKLCKEESDKNLGCKSKEEMEVEKCLAKVSDILGSKSYGSSRAEGEVRVEKRSRPNTSSGVLSRAFKHLTPKVNSRPRSSGGGFAWEVPDISGKVWSDENGEKKSNRNKEEGRKPGTPTMLRRPRSANPQFYRKKSDPVLPVLESIIDLTFDVPIDLLDEECLIEKSEDGNRPLELKHSEGLDANYTDCISDSRDRKGKSKFKGGRKVKHEKVYYDQDSSLQKKPFLRSRSGKYSVLKVTKFKSKK